nr:hypothetical protein [Tanacetum cinerariifolium]
MALAEHKKRSNELEEENIQLRIAIKGRDASLKSIKSEKTNIISEKKSIEAKYVDEIILLTNANKVAAEVSEYKRIFDELETEYENTLLAKKKLQIANKNLLIQNDTLLANGIQNDVCAIVLTYDH